jgi:hypothetical protein
MIRVLGGATAGHDFVMERPVVCPGVGVCATAGTTVRKTATGRSARNVRRIEPLLGEPILDPTFPEKALKRSGP